MTVDPELLAAALDQLGTGLLVTSADGTVVAANQATRDLLGDEATETTGATGRRAARSATPSPRR
ncbi:PAS domain-containing protein [Dactylosporangium sp. NBC_01737]|uniref:PAS domain-containing protein n=1 Tax=Dactylosporangium sp. NBC_01737 TaxID=2975959 RepID=UPI002E135401|nr:PAS domain-containing protein [Dactylosporangium sp. NBC_01737]